MEIDQYLRQSPIYLFNEIHQILFRDVKLLLKEKGVNFLQALIIVTLFLERRKKKDLRKKISPGDIFKALQVSKGGMSQNLSFLEEKGWLKRVLDQEDARSFSLELTELGELRALELMQIMELKEKNIETKMGKTHLVELVEILERFKKEYFLTHP